MEEDIYIKGFFTNWIKVSKEHAKSYCDHFISKAQNLTREEAIELVNRKFLKGITYEELEKELKDVNQRNDL